MALPEDKRRVFFDKIHSTIQKHGQIDLIDTIDPHIGRKMMNNYYNILNYAYKKQDRKSPAFLLFRMKNAFLLFLWFHQPYCFRFAQSKNICLL